MVDTTLPNIPFLQEFAVGEETKRDATEDEDKHWYRHYGAAAQTPVDWNAWEEKTVAHGGRHNGRSIDSITTQVIITSIHLQH
jgi:hypothetical protein